MITIKEVTNKKGMRIFADYPFRLYKNCPHYVPSFRSDEENIMDPKKNPYLDDAEIRCFLAYTDGELVGRVAGILQKKYNRVSGRKCMRFSRFDCVDDEEVAAALIGAVEKYAREEGMDTVHGPWGFNDQDREGLLTYGFDRRATYCTNYNYPYYEKLIRGLGYEDESEWLEYDFEIPDKVDERISRIAERLKDKFKVREVSGTIPMNKLIARYGRKAIGLVNEAYASLDCYVAVEGRSVTKVLDQFATVINPRYFSMLVDEKEDVVGMAVMLPSLCEAIKKSDGRLFPFGFVRVLKAIKHPKELEMALIAVRPDYQKTGINSLMIFRIMKNLLEDKIEKVESNPELVTNTAVQSQWTSLEKHVVKKRKCFIKRIAASETEAEAEAAAADAEN